MAAVTRLSSEEDFSLAQGKTSFSRHASAPGDVHSVAVEASGQFVNEYGQSVTVTFTVDAGNDISRILPDDGEYSLTLERSET